MASRLEVLKQIEAAEKRIADFRQKNDMRFKKNKAAELKAEKEVIELKIEAEKLLSQNLNKLADMEKNIGAISNSYRGFKDQQQEVLDISRKAGNLTEEEIGQIDSILDTSRQISDLTVEDEAQLDALTKEYELQLSKLSAIEGINQDILDKIKNQNTEATSLAGKTKEQKEVLDRSAAANEELKGKMQAFSENVQTALHHMTNLYGIMGGVLLITGKVLEKFFEVNKTLGNVGRGVTELGAQSTLLEVVFDGAAEAGKDLAEQLGSTEKVTLRLQASTLAIAHNMGITAGESANLLTSLTYLNNGSEDTAISLASGARSFAEMNNINVASMMGDLAKSTEEFALFGKDGGRNIIEAVGAAKKLGVEFAQISGIADNLLDFETSITKELELSAMLGRNINLSKARELAFAGDLAQATQETLKQIGGIAEFERMNYYQKKQTADLLGVSVAEMQKMVTNQGSLNELSEAGTDSFSTMGETLMSSVYAFLPGLAKAAGGLFLLRSLAGGAGAAVGTAMTSVAGGITSVATAVTTSVAAAGPALVGFFSSLATGLASLANPATAVGMLLVAGGFLAIGAALYMAAPALEAFANIVSSALGGIASVATAVFGGLTDMLSIITLEKAAALVAVGFSFNMLAVGIGGLAIAALLGGGRVISFIEKIGSLDTSVLSKNAMAVNSFAEGIGRLNAELQTLDTEKLEKLEDVSLSLSVGAAVTGVADSIGGMIDAASNTLFGEGGTDIQTKMHSELVLIKQALETPKGIYMDSVKVGREVGKKNDQEAANIGASIDR